ncbi:MAG: hypothetical protein Q8R10_18390 [Pseudomonas sp.]|nr:hypothetical protein [Pseudomonas sp.]MDP3848391.1 hypothetical protein [Pseudomonas sp.]
MSGHVGLRDDARIGALLAAQIARLFTPPPTATDALQGRRKAKRAV